MPEVDKSSGTLRNAGLKDNNNTTSPTADQTNPWYDRPKPRDVSSHAAVRDPQRVTGAPQDVGSVKDGKSGQRKPEVGKMLSEPKPKPPSKPSLLNP
jgi:hypothetical protein